MDVRVFAVPSAADGQRLCAELRSRRVDALAVRRGQQAYIAVWSDDPSIPDRVMGSCSRAVPVNLNHLPLPRRGESLITAPR